MNNASFYAVRLICNGHPAHYLHDQRAVTVHDHQRLPRNSGRCLACSLAWLQLGVKLELHIAHALLARVQRDEEEGMPSGVRSMVRALVA